MNFERVQEIVAETLCIPAEHVHPESTFASLGADSLESASIVVELEDEFDCTLDFAKVSTPLQQIIDYANSPSVTV